MISILKYIDGSFLQTVRLIHDDGRPHVVAERVLPDVVEQIKRDYLRTVMQCRGTDPTLAYLPALFEN